MLVWVSSNRWRWCCKSRKIRSNRLSPIKHNLIQRKQDQIIMRDRIVSRLALTSPWRRSKWESYILNSMAKDGLTLVNQDKGQALEAVWKTIKWTFHQQVIATSPLSLWTTISKTRSTVFTATLMTQRKSSNKVSRSKQKSLRKKKRKRNKRNKPNSRSHTSSIWLKNQWVMSRSQKLCKSLTTSRLIMCTRLWAHFLLREETGSRGSLQFRRQRLGRG